MEGIFKRIVTYGKPKRGDFIAKRRAARVFTKHEVRLGEAHGFRRHDFIGAGVFQNAILMDAGLMRKGEVTVRLESTDGKITSGHGTHIDTVVASAIAYVNALNKLLKMNSVSKLDLLSQS